MTAIPNFAAANLTAEALRVELLIRSILMGVRTAIPVKVLVVTPGAGSPPAIGTVDVQPLVQTVDGTGKLWPIKTVRQVPFCRAQSGASAFIIDPSVGDIGIAVACDRDVSAVLASGGQLSGPGSMRRHHISDLVYVLSIISPVAITQYLIANASGITMLSPNSVTIQAPQINLVGAVNQTSGNVTLATKVTVPNVVASADVTVPAGSVNNHFHSDPQGGDTGTMTG